MQHLSHQDQVQIARSVISILDKWGLDASQQISILNLPENTPLRRIRQYRDNTPFPDDPSIMERIEHIAGISSALATTFPRNANMAPHWMNTPHARLAGRTPVTVLVEDGLKGLINVRMLLDCAYAWSKS